MRPSDDTIAKAIGFTLFAAVFAAGAYIFQPIQDPVSTVPAPAVTVADTPSETGGPFDAPPMTPEEVASALEQAQEEAFQSMEASLPTDRPSFPVHVVTVCRDGWLSHSTGRGTCSHHGGEG